MRIFRWMSKNPADVIQVNRGSIQVGRIADIAIWDPFTSEQVSFSHTKYPTTCPYMGRELYGIMKRVFVAGTLVYDHGRFSKFRKVT